ncbi:MAG: hypothetical protein H7Z72_09880 [Bacteroidetes bacterium]|nr:hypothetical protein [Fibrella sp.]
MYIWIYYSLGIGLLLLLVHQCRWQPGPGKDRNSAGSDALFLGVVALTLTIMRLPSLCFNEELNVDESQVIASGITLLTDPVYGRSVDGTTIGPLNSYALLLPHLLGLPMDYSAARYMALLLIISSIVVFYFSLLRIVSPLVSRVSTLFITLLFAWTANDNFLHFSSELTSVLLLNTGFLLALRVLQSPRPSLIGLFGLGVLAGLIPYGKLQALPIAGMILLTLTAYLVYAHRTKAIRLLAVCGAGFVLPTALVFGVAFYYDVSDYYVNFYFVSNLLTYRQIYADVPLVQGDFWAKLISFPHFAWHHTDFFMFVLFPFFVAGGASLFGHRASRWRGLFRPVSWPVALVGLTVVAAAWSVIVPGTEFGHHLLLLVFPLGWATAVWLDRLSDRWASLPLPVRFSRLLLTACAVGLLLANTIVHACIDRFLRRTPGMVATANQTEPMASRYGWLYPANPSLFAFPTRTRIAVSPVSRIVGRYALPTDRLAVWGWHCSYYVETQLAQGVSEAHTQRSVLPNQMQAMYLARYARELDQNRPVVFLDAVGRNSLTLVRPNQRSDHFGAVRAIIRDNYRFVGDVEDVRIYVRNDYLAHHQPPAPVPPVSEPGTWQVRFIPAFIADHKKAPIHRSGLGGVHQLIPD